MSNIPYFEYEGGKCLINNTISAIIDCTGQILILKSKNYIYSCHLQVVVNSGKYTNLPKKQLQKEILGNKEFERQNI